MACRLCEDPYAEYRDIHPKCLAELRRRDAEGYCIQCGEKKVESRGTSCDECDRHYPSFSNYPGGP